MEETRSQYKMYLWWKNSKHSINEPSNGRKIFTSLCPVTLLNQKKHKILIKCFTGVIPKGSTRVIRNMPLPHWEINGNQWETEVSELMGSGLHFSVTQKPTNMRRCPPGAKMIADGAEINIFPFFAWWRNVGGRHSGIWEVIQQVDGITLFSTGVPPGNW